MKSISEEFSLTNILSKSASMLPNVANDFHIRKRNSSGTCSFHMNIRLATGHCPDRSELQSAYRKLSAENIHQPQPKPVNQQKINCFLLKSLQSRKPNFENGESDEVGMRRGLPQIGGLFCFNRKVLKRSRLTDFSLVNESLICDFQIINHNFISTCN